VTVSPPAGAPGDWRAADRNASRRHRYTTPTMNCSLSDEQLAAIAWAEPTERTADLARRIGAPYHRVYKARRHMATAGGWWCDLARSTCTECGQPLLFNAHTVPRQVHTACERARAARYLRRYRREGRPSTLSTPYVRTWRQQHPERYAAILQRARERARERWPTLPAEVRAAALAPLSESKARDQALTRAHADRALSRWSADEDELVLADSEAADRELALELGRSLYAVHMRRHYLRKRATAPEP
jgi:hypothetical protein